MVAAGHPDGRRQWVAAGSIKIITVNGIDGGLAGHPDGRQQRAVEGSIRNDPSNWD